MPDAPPPDRLAAVRATGLFHAETEAAFDRLARVAQRALGGTFATVCLLGAERQIVKGRAGTDIDEVPVLDGVCRHTVDAGVPLAIPDAAADERVSGLRAVRDGAIGAYLGVPLRMPDGAVVGSFAVCDGAPRAWTPADVETLEDLAEAVAAEIAARAALRAHGEARVHALFDRISEPDGPLGQAAETAARLRIALDAAQMGRWEADLVAGAVAQDARARALHGLPPSDEPTPYAQAVASVHPDDRGRMDAAYRAVAERGGAFDATYRALRPGGGARHLRATGQVVGTGRAARLVGVVQDVTERQHAEARLQASAARAAFRSALGDALAPLSDPAAIQAAAAETLGRHLGASRAFYAEADGEHVVVCDDYRTGVPSVAGRHRVADFGPAVESAYRAGRTLVVNDVARELELAEPERQAHVDIGVRAHVDVPLVKEGRLVALLVVHQDAPRAWTASEVALVEETAGRTWAAVERAHAQAALRESEERYRTLFESVSVGFCIVDLVYDPAGRPVDYRYVETNPTFEAQTGLSDVEGRCVSRVIPGLEPYWFEVFGRVAETGTPARRLDHAATLGRWFDVYAARVGGPGRRVALLFTDVTDQKEAEAALRASEARFRSTFENAAVGIAHVGLDGSWLRVNRRLCEIVGYTHDALLARTFQDITHPDDLGADLALFERLLAGEIEHYQMEKRYVHRDGRAVWINLTVAVARDGDGEAQHAISVIEDISDKKAAEAELVALNAVLEDRVSDRTAELARSNDELDRFAYVASHDLKAPIRAIDSLAAWVQEDAADALPPESAEHLRLLRGRAERMEGLLDGLLAYSRAGRADADAEPVRLAALVTEAVETVAPPQGFDVVLEGPALAGDAPPVVTARAPLALVVRNLIGNAIKHHDRPDGRVTVAARVEPGDTQGADEGRRRPEGRRQLVVEVADDGPGIAPEYQTRVFEMFQTLRPRDEVEGSGMGLSIVQKTVEARGGTVGVTSQGRGTTFRVSWPLGGDAQRRPD